MSIGAIAVCNERGVSIGRDIAFVAYDDIEAFTLLNPALTVIAHDVNAMGRLAVDLLTQVIAGETPASRVPATSWEFPNPPPRCSPRTAS